MNKKLTLLLAFTLTSLAAAAQNVSFLGLNPDPRSMAMGGTGTAMHRGSFTLFSNMAAVVPAEIRPMLESYEKVSRKGSVLPTENDAKGTSHIATAVVAELIRYSELRYSYMPWMRDIVKGSNLNTVALHVALGGKSSIGVGFRHFTEGEHRQYGQAGEDLGLFRPRHTSIDLGYAHRINRFSVSATIRYISSEISDAPGSERAGTVGGDVGMTYTSGWLRVALALSNFGGRIDYGQGSKEDMPMWIKSGIMCYIFKRKDHNIFGTLDLAYQIHDGNDGMMGGVGVEYTYNYRYFLRGGFRFGDEEKTSPSYGTVGAGVNLRTRGRVRKPFKMTPSFSIDAAYLITKKDSPLRNTFLVSGGIIF